MCAKVMEEAITTPTDTQTLFNKYVLSGSLISFQCIVNSFSKHFQMFLDLNQKEVKIRKMEQTVCPW